MNFEEQSKSLVFAVENQTLVNVATGDSARSFLEPGIVIDGKYEVLGLLGEGGMGAVYKVRHLFLNKEVALKTFRSSSLSNESRLRFQREAKALAKLKHKNVIQVFDFGFYDDKIPYYTMEYLRGYSLAGKLEAVRLLRVNDAIEILLQICSGLATAHSKGIIHRDLKPANIFLETSQESKGIRELVKIVDFGIAGLLRTTESQKLTTIGEVVGSPLYMSPEQSMGLPVSEQTDIYSLGCVFFEMLVGHTPYRGITAVETIMMHHSAEIPSLSQASGGQRFPLALEKTVSRMLAKTPAERQPNLAQVVEEIKQFQIQTQSGSDQNRRPVRVATYSMSEITNEQSLLTNSPTQGNGKRQVLLGICIFLVPLGLIFYLTGKEILLHKNTKASSIRESNPSQQSNKTNKTIPQSQSADTLPAVDDYLNPTPQQMKTIVEDTKGNHLDLKGTNITTTSMKIISEAHKLNWIDFLECHIENETINELRSLPLWQVSFMSSNFNDVGAKGLSNCSSLHLLNVNDTEISDTGLGYLTNLKNLYSLKVRGTKVTSDALKKLCRSCKHLKEIDLRKCKTIKPEQCRDLMAAFPSISFKTDTHP